MFSEIVLPTDLPDLYIKKYNNLFTTCGSYGFSVLNYSFANGIEILY